MGKAKLLLISLFSLASISCVETLISINVFPDGKYHMKIVSSGDEEDIENNKDNEYFIFNLINYR